MSLPRRGLVALYYGSFVLVVLAAGVGVAARDWPLAARLAPMALAYALMLLAYSLWVRSPHHRPRERRPGLWTRIALRLLEGWDDNPPPAAAEPVPDPRAA